MPTRKGHGYSWPARSAGRASVMRLRANVLITGGSGFIGGHLAERLCRSGVAVRVLDLVPPCLDVRVEHIRADVRDQGAVADAAADAGTIFHCASVVGVDRVLADPLGSIDVIINGTRAVLDAAERSSADLIHLSTSEVFGRNPQLPWSEGSDRVLGSAEVDRWSYAAAKATAEHLVIAGSRSKGIRSTVVRPFNVYGPRQDDRFVVAAMVRRALEEMPIVVHGDGSQTRAFTYVDDMIDALVRVGCRPGHVPLVDVGSTEEVAVGRLADLVRDIAGSTVPHELVPGLEEFGMGAHIPRRLPDLSRARTQLGWRPMTALTDGLRLTVESERRARDARSGCGG